MIGQRMSFLCPFGYGQVGGVGAVVVECADYDEVLVLHQRALGSGYTHSIQEVDFSE
jgi:hypothetical protein